MRGIYVLLFAFLIFSEMAVLASEPTSVDAVITADGYGSTLEDAVRDAVLNGLRTQTSSVVDASTRYEKQTLIRDGLSTTAKTVETKVNEYNKGVLKRVEVLSREKGEFGFRVTARVTIRSDEFRAFVSELAARPISVDTGKTTQAFLTNKMEGDLAEVLVRSAISPLVDKSVSIIELGDVSQTRAPELVKAFRLPRAGTTYLTIPVRIRTDPRHERLIKDLLDTASEVSVNFESLTREHVPGRAGLIIALGDFSESPANVMPSRPPMLPVPSYRELLLRWMKFQGRDSLATPPKYYFFPQEYFSVCEVLSNSVLAEQIRNQRLFIEFRDVNGALLQSSVIAPDSEQEIQAEALEQAIAYTQITDLSSPVTEGRQVYSPLFFSTFNDGLSCVLGLSSSVQFTITVAIPTEVFSNTSNISVHF